MTVVETHETIDRLLEQWRPNLGADFLPYRNHVYRVFNLSCRLASATEEDTEKLAIAAAFHDIGIWMDKTFDYLEPSSRRALDYLEQVDRQDWSESIHQIIDQHHKVRPWRGSGADLVEAFRKADWLDVCLFALPTRIDRIFLTTVLRTFPRLGFHRRLVLLALPWASRHPLNPLPILKW